MSPLSDELDDERLIRYLRGECSPVESDLIERWAAASASRQRRLELMRRAWLASGGHVLRGDVDKGWEALSAQLGDSVLSPSLQRSPQVLRVVPAGAAPSRWRVVARVAGVVAAVGAAGLFGRMTQRRLSNPAQSAGTMREIVTKPGQRAEVYLSDGTHVVLNVASRLRFPANFGSSRDVELQGQAYFDVVHEPRAFAVHTDAAVVRDVGTKFDVRAYGKSEHTVVAVTDGAVVVKVGARTQHNGDSLVLRRSGVGVVAPDGKLTAETSADVDGLIRWTAGTLVFRRTPAREAVAQLSRWYGTDVRLGDSALGKLELTMSISSESKVEAVRMLAHALDARIEERSSTVTLFTRTAR